MRRVYDVMALATPPGPQDPDPTVEEHVPATGEPMVDQDKLVRVYAEYVSNLMRRYAVADLLYRLAEHALDVLQVDGARVCVANQHGELHTVAAAGVNAASTDPAMCLNTCTDAHRTSSIVAIDDLATSEAAPATDPLPDQGAVAGIPLMVEERPIGALHLQHDRPHPWSVEELEVACLLADMAAGYIVNARTLASSERLARQLQKALDSRVAIEQAKGVLAERHGLSPAEAFERLRTRARDGNLPLRDVASRIVDGSLQA